MFERPQPDAMTSSAVPFCRAGVKQGAFQATAGQCQQHAAAGVFSCCTACALATESWQLHRAVAPCDDVVCALQAAAAGTDAAAGGATAALQAAEQNPRKANIVTSWAGGAAGAAARKSCVAGARKSILPAAAGRKSSVPAVGPAANAAAGGAGQCART
jgi:hypothetical protein